MATTESYTLQMWISQFRSQLNTIDDFLRKDAIGDGTDIQFVMEETILAKYNEELKPYLKEVELSDRERAHYKYNPRLFAYDLYGAPEFWYLIMYANELHSLLQFDLKRVKFYTEGVIIMLNQIRAIELPYRDENEQQMTNVIVNQTPKNTDLLTDPIFT